MSSPIAIPRSSKATTGSSPSSSASSSGLYVPVHKRTTSSSSSSRAASPSSPRFSVNAQPHSRIYTPSFLLSLRPYADESMKEKMRGGECPEMVMNRRTRKNLEFMEHQKEKLMKMSRKHEGGQYNNANITSVSVSPVHDITFPTSPALSSVPTSTSTPAPASIAHLTGITPRQPPRRTRAGSRASPADRTSRKQVLKLRSMESGNNANWRMHGPVQALSVV